MTPRAIVFGGYGVFGGHVSRELARLGADVTIAGRDPAKASAAARALAALPGARERASGHRGVAADLTDPASCAAALVGHAVAVNCAGPFSSFGFALVDACLEARVHHVDIADDRAWAAKIRGADDRFRDRGLAAVYGASSLPAISGALAILARENCPAVPELALVALFIGNDNPKGEGAVRSAAAVAGAPISAPQGELAGFRDAEPMTFPPPFGRRVVRNFESPDYDLLPALTGARAVCVKVGFESRIGNFLFGALGRLPAGAVPRIAGALCAIGRVAPRTGHSGGAVQVELSARGFRTRASLSAPVDGQRLAALPAAFAAKHLLDALAPARARLGAMTAYELLGAAVMIEKITAEGFSLHRG